MTSDVLVYLSLVALWLVTVWGYKRTEKQRDEAEAIIVRQNARQAFLMAELGRHGLTVEWRVEDISDDLADLDEMGTVADIPGWGE